MDYSLVIFWKNFTRLSSETQISKLSGLVLTICGVYIPSPASDTRNEMQTTLVSRSPVDTVRIEESGEKIVAKDSLADVEAIQDILMEIADMRYPVYPSLCSIK